ncbi:A disintegrin and metalloproteinase with thrombospondin motifs 17 [Microtus ochrogaster]|uniref:A disintegrin and metalloproteinase with thrombospondin motifs 17 n=1 Tax=Microtus ochrogaster TaxID=79684 RepID=A0A8J6FWG4_MICOH|nr:A disintegrin and metalloproteinase with thrombospondin motifs 17 [Microtus ochrogaster]
MCDGALLPPLVLSLLLLVWGLDPGTAVGDAAADVEVVLPRRLRPDDVHLQLQPGVAGLRQWRRQRASLGGPRAGPGERALLLHLPAFGRDLYLQLRRDLRFLSPGFEVEEAGAAGSSGHPAELCYYSGRVLGHPGSLVSLSACGASGGLVGLIQLEQEQLFIQPLNNSGGPFSGREHLIRRKWSSAPNPSPEVEEPRQPCKVVTEKKPRKDKPSRDWRERRNAIRLTNEHTVETLVVADANMVQYHGAEAAQRFILTVMNMVYNMFQHQSLGIKINIQVTKLVLLRQRPTKLSIGHHGERSLESFCHWQNEEYGGARYLGNNQVPGGKDDAPPVDAAVFVTSMLAREHLQLLLTDSGNLLGRRVDAVGGTLGMAFGDYGTFYRTPKGSGDGEDRCFESEFCLDAQCPKMLSCQPTSGHLGINIVKQNRTMGYHVHLIVPFYPRRTDFCVHKDEPCDTVGGISSSSSPCPKLPHPTEACMLSVLSLDLQAMCPSAPPGELENFLCTLLNGYFITGKE